MNSVWRLVLTDGGQVFQVPGPVRGDDTLVPPDDRPRNSGLISLYLLPCCLAQSVSRSAHPGCRGTLVGRRVLWIGICFTFRYRVLSSSARIVLREVAGPFNHGDGAQVLKLKVHNGIKREVHSIIIKETWGVPRASSIIKDHLIKSNLIRFPTQFWAPSPEDCAQD